jgi:hypothetical protein
MGSRSRPVLQDGGRGGAPSSQMSILFSTPQQQGPISSTGERMAINAPPQLPPVQSVSQVVRFLYPTTVLPSTGETVTMRGTGIGLRTRESYSGAAYPPGSHANALDSYRYRPPS